MFGNHMPAAKLGWPGATTTKGNLEYRRASIENSGRRFPAQRADSIRI